MISVLFNVLTVVVGSTLGLLLKKGIPSRVSSAAMAALALCTLYIGVDGALAGNNAIVAIVSMVLGTVAGTLIGIDRALERLGSFFEKALKQTGSTSLAQGFVTASLLFCVGAMTVVGCLQAGLSGDAKLIYTKSILDLISSFMLASTLGIGVLLSAVFVFVYQGGLVLLAGLLQGFLTDTVLIGELTCVGSLMIIGLGLNILGVTKLKIADMLPSLLFVPPIYYLVDLIPL